MFLEKEKVASPRLSALNELRGLSARRALVVPPTFEQLLVTHGALPGLAECAEPLEALLAQIGEAIEATLARGRDFDEVWGLIRLRDAVGHLILDRVSEYAQDVILVADRVVRDLFQRFFDHPRVRSLDTVHADRFVPLVSLSLEGLYSFSTVPIYRSNPPLSLAWVNLPHEAMTNVWLWLGLPHEVGHDIYAAVAPTDGPTSAYAAHLEGAVAERVAWTVMSCGRGMISIVDGPWLGLEGSAAFMATLWRRWCNEAHADAVGILQVGPAAATSLQEILMARWIDSVEDTRPPAAVRSRLATRLLARLRVDEYNSALEQRMPLGDVVLGDSAGTRYLVPAALMDAVVAAVADLLLTFRNPALDHCALLDVLPFDRTDQERIEQCAAGLLDRRPLPQGAESRHLLAGARLAYERHPRCADELHRRTLGLLAELV
jgi:hypothetical protein